MATSAGAPDGGASGDPDRAYVCYCYEMAIACEYWE
jgi:hypothetical protein